MSDGNDLFSNDENKIPVIDPDKNYYEEFVGEGKKFKTPEELAKAKAHADAFIERLEDEAAQLRQELQKRVTIEELMDKINQNAPGNQEPPASPGRETPPADVISPDKIEEIVSTRLKAEEEKKRRANNSAYVRNELSKAFGKDYVSRLKERAEQLGVTPEYFNELAATQPKVALELIGRKPVQEKSTEFNPPRTEMSRIPSGGTEKRYSYYKKLQQTNLKEYLSPRVQNEMAREALRQGDSFYDS